MLGDQFKIVNIHNKYFNYNIVIKKRRDILEPRGVLLIFSLDL